MEEIIEQIGILTPALVIGLGLSAGIEHAFEPDHVVAVSTQISKFQKSTRQRIKESLTKSSLLGVFWGAGHTTTLILIGVLVYSLAITIQSQIFSGFEFAVGMMLVFLGVTTIINKKMRFRHKHPHQHKDGTLHFEEHNHSDSNHNHTHRSYFIGLVHGLAGSGSLVVLTATTLDNLGMVLEFIVVFGIGSTVGMALVGSIIGIPLAFGNKLRIVQKVFRYMAGVFSLVIGINIMYQIGIVNHLFGI